MRLCSGHSTQETKTSRGDRWRRNHLCRGPSARNGGSDEGDTTVRGLGRSGERAWVDLAPAAVSHEGALSPCMEAGDTCCGGRPACRAVGLIASTPASLGFSPCPHAASCLATPSIASSIPSPPSPASRASSLGDRCAAPPGANGPGACGRSFPPKAAGAAGGGRGGGEHRRSRVRSRWNFVASWSRWRYSRCSESSSRRMSSRALVSATTLFCSADSFSAVAAHSAQRIAPCCSVRRKRTGPACRLAKGDARGAVALPLTMLQLSSMLASCSCSMTSLSREETVEFSPIPPLAPTSASSPRERSSMPRLIAIDQAISAP